MFNFLLFSFRPSCVNATCKVHMFGIKRQGLPRNASRFRRLPDCCFFISIGVTFDSHECEVSYFFFLDHDAV
jgi:hypothetical protein